MEKRIRPTGKVLPDRCRKIFLLLFMLLGFAITANASLKAQNQLVTLILKDVSVGDALGQLERQTGMDFFFSNRQVDVRRRVTVEIRDEELDKALEILLGDKYSWEYVDNVVAIRIRDTTTKQQPQQARLVPVGGFIRNNSGEALIGAVVMVKGTQTGSVSDARGRFMIRVPEGPGTVLVFSFLGMKSKEVAFTGQAEINVVLEADEAQIQEVVVTGFFQRNMESFSGSATTYSGSELKLISTGNVLESLKVLDPDFNITESNEFGSDPNRLPDIDIRGKTTILDPRATYQNDPNLPLFVIDGFTATLEDVMNLSMSRVASLTVLKDATSTAFYGSQSANGVVVIETVKPAQGKLRVQYTGNLDLSLPDLTDYNLMDASEKLRFERESGAYDGSDAVQSYYFDMLYNQRLARVNSGVDTYWLSKPLRTGVSTRHNLYVSGGDRVFTYGVGARYDNVQGVMKKSGNDKVGLNIDLTYRRDRWSVSNKFSLDSYNAHNAPVSFYTYATANPYYPDSYEGSIPKYLEDFVVTDANNYKKLIQEANPDYNASLNYLDRSNYISFRNSTYIDAILLDGLRVTARFSITQRRNENEIFKSPFHTDFENTPKQERGRYRKTNSRSGSYMGGITLNYSKLFGEKHLLNVIGAIDFTSAESKNEGYTAIGFADDNIMAPSYAISYQKNSQPSYNESLSRNGSAFVTGNYTYDNRYIADFTFRVDATSNFGSSQVYRNTWSVGAAWNLHNEAFMPAAVDMLRLRVSVGNPGNSQNNYQTDKTYSYLSGYSNVFGSGLIVQNFGNPKLGWEETMQYNLGLNFTGFKKAVSLTFDAYRKIADPMLLNLNTPTSTGRKQLLTNMGRNTINGISFSVNGNIINRPTDGIIWSVGANGRSLTSEFSKMGDLTEINEALKENKSMRRYYNGGSMYDIWAVRSGGIDPSTGREVFIKKDGTYTFLYDIDDEMVVGNSMPKLEGRLNTRFIYKGWQVSLYFNYQIKGWDLNRELYQRIEGLLDYQVLNRNQDRRALYQRWKQVGDVAQYKNIRDLSGRMQNEDISDRYLQKKNWFSGESISVRYDFRHSAWLQRSFISNLAVECIVNDIFHWSTVKRERGLNYPFARKVAFQINLSF
ncbi:SusC/RagA family TonB-linked outer membrane protein [Alistipes sp. OttesenSCG-928-B03]|nr:SusC/RagA family TonB-linked outer membrane protein [Alistipes sp. OttesenSCG-928-B03]